jgi:hypothetical protein
MKSLPGRPAVARLTQGIPPKYCALPVRRAEGGWKNVSIHKSLTGGRHWRSPMSKTATITRRRLIRTAGVTGGFSVLGVGPSGHAKKASTQQAAPSKRAPIEPTTVKRRGGEAGESAFGIVAPLADAVQPFADDKPDRLPRRYAGQCRPHVDSTLSARSIGLPDRPRHVVLTTDRFRTRRMSAALVIDGKLLDAEAEPMRYRETGAMDGASTLYPEVLGES